MRKHALLFLALAPMFALASCDDPGQANSSTGSTAAGKNNLSSVLRSFGDNMRVNNIFNFVDSDTAISVMTDYVKEGCFYTFRNIPNSPENFGFVSKGGKTNRYTLPDGKEPLVLGDELLKDGQAVESFRDVYYDPSFIGAHADDYLASNVFIPDKEGNVHGTFTLYKTRDIGEGKVQDNTTLLENLSKSMGVYDTVMAFDDPSTPEPELALNRAQLYFAENGSTFTLRFYHSYKGGFDGLLVSCTISGIGSTAIKAISDFVAAK